MNWIKSFNDELDKLANMGKVDQMVNQGMSKQEAMKKVYPQGMPNKGQGVAPKTSNDLDASPNKPSGQPGV